LTCRHSLAQEREISTGVPSGTVRAGLVISLTDLAGATLLLDPRAANPGHYDAILDGFLTTALAHYEPGSISLEVTAMIAEDDQVVLQWTSRARTLDGDPYENGCLGIFTVRDGKIRAVREYMDTLYAHDVAFASG
jgi:SnoaL-like domain